MSAENVAIVKSSWAGWRQGLHDQWVRDFGEGVAERVEEWSRSAGSPDLQSEEFIDGGETVLVRARAVDGGETLWFRYELDGTTIAGWHVHADEQAARQAAGL